MSKSRKKFFYKDVEIINKAMFPHQTQFYEGWDNLTNKQKLSALNSAGAEAKKRIGDFIDAAKHSNFRDQVTALVKEGDLVKRYDTIIDVKQVGGRTLVDIKAATLTKDGKVTREINLAKDRFIPFGVHDRTAYETRKELLKAIKKERNITDDTIRRHYSKLSDEELRNKLSDKAKAKLDEKLDSLDLAKIKEKEMQQLTKWDAKNYKRIDTDPKLYTIDETPEDEEPEGVLDVVRRSVEDPTVLGAGLQALEDYKKSQEPEGKRPAEILPITPVEKAGWWQKRDEPINFVAHQFTGYPDAVEIRSVKHLEDEVKEIMRYPDPNIQLRNLQYIGDDITGLISKKVTIRGIEVTKANLLRGLFPSEEEFKQQQRIVQGVRDEWDRIKAKNSIKDTLKFINKYSRVYRMFPYNDKK